MHNPLQQSEDIMKRLIVAAIAAACLVSSTPVFAGDVASVFDKWAIQSVSKVTDLTAEQFQFVRALYGAIPRVSPTLPPGDHPVMASSGGSVMLALVADGQACAVSRPRFHPGDTDSGRSTSDRRAGHAALTRMTFLEDENGSTRAMCGFMSCAVAAQAWRLV